MPTSDVMSCDNSSACSFIAAESLFRHSARSSTGVSDQEGKAARAEATAASMSAADPTGTEPINCSLAGLTTSIEPSPRGATHSPPMYRCSRVCMPVRLSSVL